MIFVVPLILNQKVCTPPKASKPMSDNDLSQPPENSGNDGATLGPPPDGKSPRGGAPRNNVNRVTHGLRSKRDGIVLAKLGRKAAGLYHDAMRLRKAIERLVGERCGGVTLRQRMRIQTACRLEMGIRSLELGLRDERQVSLSELRSTRESIARWTVQRDNVLAALLGNAQTSEWDVVDRMLRQEDDQGDDDQDDDQTDQEADGEADGADGSVDGQEGERLPDGDQGDDAADGEGGASNDVWREADRLMGLDPHPGFE